ncbi:MAG: mechanosensitive ion channel [Clostridiales bacterium]|nr:mechanosensitive ion channel [Clostridiales bacterium]
MKEKTIEKTLNYLQEFLDWFVYKAGAIALCIFILVVGFRVVKSIKRWLKQSFERHNMDASVSSFLVSFVDIGLKMVLFLWVISIIGVEMSSVIAILSSASIAIGLAVQGSLSNIAGGVLILLLKPFQVGDYIIEDNKKNEGTVVAIDIFYTKLYTVDNKTVVIPNGTLSNSSLTNVTREEKRRIDLFIGISYQESVKRVKEVLARVIDAEENILKEEGVTIFVNDFEASTVSIGVRVWAPMDCFWATKWSLLENIKEAFDEEGISFPYNQLDVHMIEVPKKKKEI